MKSEIYLRFVIFGLLLIIGFTCRGQFLWVQKGTSLYNNVASTFSGSAVSINSDGSVVAIGIPHSNSNGGWSGQVKVYQYVGSSWVQMGSSINGSAADDQAGHSVSLSSDGTVLAIGSPYFNTSTNRCGQVRVFKFVSGNWVQQGLSIFGSSAYDYFGVSVSLNFDGTILSVGSPFAGNELGKVQTFQYSGGTWTQLGNTISGELTGDEFGYSVSLNSSGTSLAAGAPHNDCNGSFSGNTRVFQFSSGSWIQMGTNITGDSASDECGTSVSLSADGLTIAVGYPQGSLLTVGKTKVFNFSGGIWTQVGADIVGKSINEEAGCSVSLSSDGSIVAVGSRYNNDNAYKSGMSRVFQYIGGLWQQIGNNIYGDAVQDYSGSSVSLSSNGAVIAVGAPYNSGYAFEAGQTKVFQYQMCNSHINSSVTSATICAGDTTTISVSGANTYQWNNGLGADSTYSLTPMANTTYIITGTDSDGCWDTAVVQITVLANVNILTSVLPICEGDSVNLNAAGADNYLWSNGAGSGAFINVSPSITTTYTVTGTTGICSNTDSIIITVKPLPQVNATSLPDSICRFGSDATLYVSGADSYQWSNGLGTDTTFNVSPYSTTLYSVTGTSNGCVNSDTVRVTVIVNPSISVSASSFYSCAGDPVTMTASGADSYEWSNGLGAGAVQVVMPTVTTEYSVTGTSMGCSAIYAASIQVLGDVIVTVSDSAICRGESTSINVSGCISYNWSSGLGTGTNVVVSPQTTTTYSVTGSEYGCTQVVPVIINVFPSLDICFNSLDSTYCLSDSAQLFSVTPSGGIISGQGVTGNVFDPALAGIGNWYIFYYLTDSNGCYNSDSVLVEVDLCDAIDESYIEYIEVYPNPVDQILNIMLPSGIPVSIFMTDAIGRILLYDYNSTQNIYQIDMSDFATGVYNLNIITPGSSVNSRVVIKL